MSKALSISPFLWFDDNAEEAARLYCKLFKNSKITSIQRRGEGKSAPAFWLSVSLDGLELKLLNGGPHYKLNPAFSLMVDCASQRDVDTIWAKLGDGGQELRCGWITDRFGVTWQIIPAGFHELMADPDPERRARAHAAMMTMQKLDIKALREAAGPAAKAPAKAKTKAKAKSAKVKAKPKKK